MMALITRKEKELNRSIYFVPVVYDKEAFKETYKITSEEITFIFFEKGKEKNRFTYEELTTPTNELMPGLNRLPMWNIKVLESDEYKKMGNYPNEDSIKIIEDILVVKF